MSRIADFLTDPSHAVKIHVAFGLLWLGPGTIVTLLWLSNATSWISWMSLYAIVVAHWSGLQGALADKRVKRQGGDVEEDSGSPNR